MIPFVKQLYNDCKTNQDWSLENKKTQSIVARIGGIALAILAAGLAIGGIAALAGGSMSGIGFILGGALTALIAHDFIVMGNNLGKTMGTMWDNTIIQKINYAIFGKPSMGKRIADQIGNVLS